MTRWKLTLEYDGRPFVGWQRQANGPSVQGVLEEAVHGFCGERVTVAWVLLGGVNSGADEAAALARLLPPDKIRLRINLIDVNDARPVEQGGFSRATDDERRAFMGHLQVMQAPIVRRYSGGAQKHAACGMLQSLRCQKADPNSEVA